MKKFLRMQWNPLSQADRLWVTSQRNSGKPATMATMRGWRAMSIGKTVAPLRRETY